MTDIDFNELGRAGAIEALYKDSGYNLKAGHNFETSVRTRIHSHSCTYLEGTHFDLTYFPLKHLGHKCVTASTAELYADLCEPVNMNVVLGISSKLRFSHIKELWQGITSAAREYGYKDVSLDLVPSRNGLSINIGAIGTEHYAGAQAKAKSMDLVCVSGRLGSAYIGMCVLEREKKRFVQEGEKAQQPDLEKYKMFVGSYLKPELSPATVGHLKETGIRPSYGYVVKSGLADAVKRLSADSGFGVKVYASMIPFEGNSFEFGRELDIDPISAAMNGGDDYRLMFTIPIAKAEQFRRDFQTFDIIGHLAQPEAGTVLVTPDGAEIPIRSQGWKDEE